MNSSRFLKSTSSPLGYIALQRRIHHLLCLARALVREVLTTTLQIKQKDSLMPLTPALADQQDAEAAFGAEGVTAQCEARRCRRNACATPAVICVMLANIPFGHTSAVDLHLSWAWSGLHVHPAAFGWQATGVLRGRVMPSRVCRHIMKEFQATPCTCGVQVRFDTQTLFGKMPVAVDAAQQTVMAHIAAQAEARMRSNCSAEVRPSTQRTCLAQAFPRPRHVAKLACQHMQRRS